MGVDQTSGCAQNSPLWHAPAAVAISGIDVPGRASAPVRQGYGRSSVSFVAVNAEQAEDWNGASGREFIEQRERHERMLGRLRARLLAAAKIEDGEDVLDVGCGCGELTILAARATGSGHALGADFSRIQVAEARRLAAAAGAANARFEVADAQVHPFGAGAFDVVASSLGMMFFDDPAAAFANLRKSLRRGGRLAFLCWRTREENPVFTTGFAEAAAVLGYREKPGPSAAFSLADAGRVAALLSSAGFGGVDFTRADESMLIGSDVDDVIRYERASPTATEILTGLSPAQAIELTRQVRDGLAAYASPDGVTMPGAAWLVTARASAPHAVSPPCR
jgi:SAM-dependent methyltransferase